MYLLQEAGESAQFSGFQINLTPHTRHQFNLKQFKFMKKTNNWGCGYRIITAQKIFLMMKLSLLLFFVGVLQLSASVYSQNTRFNFKVEQGSVKSVLDYIEENSKFRLFYEESIVDTERRVSITANDKSIEDILGELFTGEGISWNILENNFIVLQKKETDPGRALQQSTKVSGKVTDSSGFPLPGVTVVVKGTTMGIITNSDGYYVLDKIPGNAILQFSFVGMKTQEITVSGKISINVTMEEETIGIDEIVAIGYGTMKKSDLTGAMSSVNESMIQNEPIQRTEQLLQGRASGVTVTTTSGAPAGGIMIRIRGANSINGGNDPLYIVDGVANSSLFQLLDVNDIQSIEILKDASSTAIYGSRGANGVIIVTTKKGSQGKSELQFETQQNFGIASKEYDMLSAAEFATFYNEYRNNNGATDYFTEEEISEWEKNGGTDWQDLMLQTAHTQNYKLSLSGGTPKVRYYVSGNVRDANGILIKSKYKKYGLRANIDADVFDWLKANFEVNASHSKTERNDSSDNLWIALNYSPTVSLYDSDGNWNLDPIGCYKDNPYGTRIQDKDDATSNYFGATTRFVFKLPVKGLTLDILGNANYKGDKSYFLSTTEKNLHDSNYASNEAMEYFNWQNTNQLTYTNQWGIHNLTATLVAEYSQQKYDNLYVDVNNLATESVGYWNLNLGSIDDYGNSYSKSTLASYVGRVMYQLNDKYLATATVRRDGSSKFQGDNKWGYFPSVALAWRASSESFISKLNIFDHLKIRASWGITGNQAIDAYSTLGMLAESNYSWGTATSYPGYWAEDMATPDLTWEKTYQWDAGIDMGFFKNRLNASIDLYKKDTKDLLLEKAIAYYDGGGSVYTNLGHVRNKGIEISLDAFPVKRNNISWESILTFAYSKNEVINMGDDEILFPGDDDTSVLQVGKPMGSIWGYTWLGLWSTEEADQASLYGQSPGDNKFLDKNGDYEIDSNDQGFIGHAFPDYTFGWNNTFSWKNFELNLFMQGAIGADRINITRYEMSEATSNAKFVTTKEGYYNMWTTDNQDTNIPNIYSLTINTQPVSTQYMESADFLRLKNLSIGYNVPESHSNKLKLKISASVQNLFTITSYSGYDPEITSSGTSDTDTGVDKGAYPMPRTYTLGLRINF